MRRSNARSWVGVAGLAAVIIGAIPAYFVFWNKANLVYEQHLVDVFLPEQLKSISQELQTVSLPDKLLLVAIQNIGHKPSELVEAVIEPSGEITHYEVDKPNLAYGKVDVSREGAHVRLSCPRLVQGEHAIRVSVWFKHDSKKKLNIGIVDKSGPATKVHAIDAKKELWLSSMKTVSSTLGIVLAIVWAQWYYSFVKERRTREAMGNLIRHAEVAPVPGTTSYNWIPFIQRMRALETSKKYLSVKWLREKVFSEDPEAQEALQVAIDTKMLLTYYRKNPKNPKFPTLCCKMDWDHPMLQVGLGSPSYD